MRPIDPASTCIAAAGLNIDPDEPDLFRSTGRPAVFIEVGQGKFLDVIDQRVGRDRSLD